MVDAACKRSDNTFHFHLEEQRRKAIYRNVAINRQLIYLQVVLFCQHIHYRPFFG